MLQWIKDEDLLAYCMQILSCNLQTRTVLEMFKTIRYRHAQEANVTKVCFYDCVWNVRIERLTKY